MTSLMRCCSGEILIERVFVKSTFWGKFRGLLFCRDLDKDSAILLVSTSRVHTCGLLFPLDLYFFDSSMVLIDSCRRIQPFKIPSSPKGTKHILEVKHREEVEPLKLEEGDKVSLLWEIPK